MVPESAGTAVSTPRPLPSSATGAASSQSCVWAALHASQPMLYTCKSPGKIEVHNCRPASMQHLIVDGSPKWDIYRTVPVSSAPSSSAAASTPQAANNEAALAPAPAKRDPLLDAATAGGVLLGSGKYTFQVMGSIGKNLLHPEIFHSSLQDLWHISGW